MGNFSFGLPPKFTDPIRYVGEDMTTLPAVNVARAPTVNDRNYPLYTFWRNSNPNAISPDAEGDCWLLIKFRPHTITFLDAIWVKLTAGSIPGGTVVSLSDTANVKVFPDVTGNIQLVGGAGISIVSTPPSNLLTVSLTGGGIAIDQINVDAHTAPGTDPVLPDGAGQITITGGQVATGVIGANVIRTDSLAANTFTIEIQRSTAVAATDSTKNGVSHYSSAQFDVDANAFVTLKGGVTPALLSISDDANPNPAPGVVVVPFTNGNIQLAGHVFEGDGVTHIPTVVGGANLLNINPMSASRWIVDSKGFNGTHTTIASALTSASSGDTIFILAGTYTENLTLKAGVNLTAYECDAQSPNVTIIGKLSASFAGHVAITGIRLQTNSDFVLEVTGASATLIDIFYCFINATNNAAISCTSSGGAIINTAYCFGSLGAAGAKYFGLTAGTINVRFCRIINDGVSTPSTLSNGAAATVKWCLFGNDITTSDNAAIAIYFSEVGKATLNGTGTSAIRFCFVGTITSGPGANFPILHCEVASADANAITGTGQISYSGITYEGTNTINTTSQLTIPTGPRIALAPLTGTIVPEMMAGDASPDTVVTAPKGSFYLRTDGSSAITRAYINTDGATAWTAVTTVA